MSDRFPSPERDSGSDSPHDPNFALRVYRYLENRHSPEDLSQLKLDLRADSGKRDQFVSLALTRQSIRQWLRGRAQFRKEMQFDRETPPLRSADPTLDEAMILPALDISPTGDLSADHLERFDPTPHVPRASVRSTGWWRRPVSIAAAIIMTVAASIIAWNAFQDRTKPIAVAPVHNSALPPLSVLQPTTAPASPASDHSTASASFADVGICLGTHWDETRDIVRGSQLLPGPHTLSSGVAQITLAGGASVVLQAPCRFEVQSANHLQLFDGQISASCPHGCAGLSVRTPDMDAVDLGTEFGVAVSPLQQTHLEVFKGSVRAAPVEVSSAGSIVTTDQAVVVKTGLHALLNDIPTPLAFVRYQELADRAAAGDNDGYNRWRAFSQTLRQDPDLVAYYTFEKDENQPNKLVNQSLRTLSKHDGVLGVAGVDGSVPQWSTGRWAGKSALQFGEQTKNVVRIPNGDELNPLPPLTYMMWLKRWDVRRPVHILSSAAGAVRSLDLTLIGMDGEKAPFREINSIYFDMGPSKSAQQSRRQGVYKVLGTDFAWSLITLTMGPDNVAQVYVDGARVGEFPVVIPPLDRTGELWLGQPDPAAKDLGKSLVFHGWIDEFAIFHRCLAEVEIRRIYEAGKPR